jgi:hypothetical protein
MIKNDVFSEEFPSLSRKVYLWNAFSYKLWGMEATRDWRGASLVGCGLTFVRALELSHIDPSGCGGAGMSYLVFRSPFFSSKQQSPSITA